MILGRNSKCWCGSGLKYKNCHELFDDRIADFKRRGYKVPGHDIIKTPEQIAKIKESAVINRACLDYVGEHIKAGISTQEIDDWVSKVTKDMGGIPATLGYEGFPKSVCTSINSQVCHGIPSEEDILEEGDIINVDCTTILDGYYPDSSRMYMIGGVSPEAKKLVEDVHEAVNVGLRAVKPWTPLGDMGAAVNEFCMSKGYSVVREIGGHGVGLDFHEDPWVSYVAERGTEMLMVPGLMFTIEPMVNMGGPDIFIDADNDWTVYTDDDSLSAQWEVQIVVTEDGYDLISW